MAALCRTGAPFLGIDQSPKDVRTDAGVVERGGLENRCASNGTQGSNPCLSATFQHPFRVLYPHYIFVIGAAAQGQLPLMT